MKKILTILFLIAFLLTSMGVFGAQTIDRAFELACLSMTFGVGAVITSRWTSSMTGFFKDMLHDDEC